MIMLGKIAGYYRISMEDKQLKEESSSISGQRLIIRRYISEHKELSDCEYCEFYDDGYSGTTMNRPGIRTLLELVQQSKVCCVIVKDLSRFSRDYIEMGTYLEHIFPFMGIRFISVSDHYDSNDYIGKTADLDVGFKSLLSDFYCKDVSVKVRSSLAAKRRKGIYATGNTPFGYCKSRDNPNELQIVPEEANVVRYIFKLSLSGLNLTEICRTLNDENINTPLAFKKMRNRQKRRESEQKKLWQPGTVRAVLLNESYIGSMVYNKTFQKEVGGGRAVRKPRKEWKVIKNHHEAIIGKWMFEQVQEQYPSKISGKRRPVEYALKGKVFCSACGRTLKVMKLSGGKLFYYCENHSLSSGNECMADRIGNDLVEQIVLAQIRGRIEQLADSEEIRNIVSLQRQEQLQRKERETADIKREVACITEEKVKLLEKYHEGGLGRNEYMEYRRRLEQRIAQKRTEIEKSDRHSEGFLQAASFDVLTAEMAAAFVSRIEIDGHRTIHIYWKFGAGKNGNFIHDFTGNCLEES